MAPTTGRVASEAEPGAYRWMRPLALVAVGFVVATSFNSKPDPGATGQHLVVSAALIIFALGTAAIIRLPLGPPKVQFVILLVVVGSAAVLVGLQPNGPGFLGEFPAVSAAALRLPVAASASVAAVGVAALAVAWTLGPSTRPVVGVVLNEFGVVAFYLLAMFARRYQEANVRAHELIEELEQTRAAQAQAAALGERQRLAREMHDVLAHTLSGLVLNLEGARLVAERGSADPEIAHAIGRAHRLARTGLDEARRAIAMLRGDALPGPDGLGELASTFESDTGVPCAYTTDGRERELGTDARLAVYRVAQEALTNIRKHARPERVEVCLAYNLQGVRLRVEDFGDVSAATPHDGTSGYGLTGMRERAELIGGALTAVPTASGFRVELEVPA